MSGRLLRLACTAVCALSSLAFTVPPEPAAPADGDDRTVIALLTDLQRLYREAEQASETYNATEEQLKRQRAEVRRLDTELARARTSLHDSRAAAGRLARQQYQSTSDLSPYLRLLLASDARRALDQGHVIGQVARERAATVDRLTGGERKAGSLAREARKALDTQLALARKQREQRDKVTGRLDEVERLLASLTAEQLTELSAREERETEKSQKTFMASGALSSTAKNPTAQGERALRYAVEQLGKPYEWGAEGPDTYDCSGLTSQAWADAGTPIPRTSQEQWARLDHVPLDRLRPGDLVIYFPEATHVALYLGNGKVIQAPRPDTKIKISPIAANPILGAVRPDPGSTPMPTYTPLTLPENAEQGSNEGFNGIF
ncbi:NlpC/P60 family protein [Streptomyces sp. NPDC048290]|uniref:C40 family peptidase n=1 Tax=Streptomyces sp. NPDC048290 TaxID=3155811 RepID=UPI00343588C7